MPEQKTKYKSLDRLELNDITLKNEKEYKKIHCPSCAEEVASNNLNLQNLVAKCNACNVIFSIEEDIDKVKIKKEIKQKVLRPEGIELFYFNDNLDITIDQHIQGINAFGVFSFPPFAILSLLLYFDENKINLSIYVPIVLFLISFYFIYKAINYSKKNKSYIEINDDELTLKSRPKNFKKDKTFSSSDIDQFYLKKSSDGYGYFEIYMLLNTLNGQKHEKLLTVDTLSKANYLEQEFEKHLGIKDRIVAESNV